MAERTDTKRRTTITRRNKQSVIKRVWAICTFDNWEKEAGDIKRNHVFKLHRLSKNAVDTLSDFEDLGIPFRIYLRRGYTKVYSWKLAKDVTFWEGIVVVSW